MKPGCFAVSLNARYPDMQPNFCSKLVASCLRFEDKEFVALSITSAWKRACSAVTFHGWSGGSLIRLTLEKANSYESARDIFSSSRMLVPCYFILSGSKYCEGIIIARGLEPTNTKCLILEEHKALVQTNVDWEEVRHESEINFNALSLAELRTRATTAEIPLVHSNGLRLKKNELIEALEAAPRILISSTGGNADIRTSPRKPHQANLTSIATAFAVLSSSCCSNFLIEPASDFNSVERYQAACLAIQRAGSEAQITGMQAAEILTSSLNQKV